MQTEMRFAAYDPNAIQKEETVLQGWCKEQKLTKFVRCFKIAAPDKASPAEFLLSELFLKRHTCRIAERDMPAFPHASNQWGENEKLRMWKGHNPRDGSDPPVATGYPVYKHSSGKTLV